MMKKILSIAFASMILFGATSYAQTTQANDSETSKECKVKKCDKQAKFGEEGCMAGQCEFEGLNLTDQQKSQLKELKSKQREEFKARKEAAKAEKKEKKEQAKADRKAMKEQREADRRAYLDKVKEIVGQDNYVIFLENQYIQESGRPDIDKAQRGGKNMKHAKANFKKDGVENNISAKNKDVKKGDKVKQGKDKKGKKDGKRIDKKERSNNNETV